MSVCLVALMLAVFSSTGWSAETAPGSPRWRVYFSPKGGCTEAIVDALNKSTSSVLVQAFMFTSAPIARALVEARRRGVKVEVVLDKSHLADKYSSATFLHNNLIPCYIDAMHTNAHNKVMIIDRKTVITGSFNFTKSAEENNAENLLVITDAALAAQYAQNWHLHRRHSARYKGLVSDSAHPR